MINIQFIKGVFLNKKWEYLTLTFIFLVSVALVRWGLGIYFDEASDNQWIDWYAHGSITIGKITNFGPFASIYRLIPVYIPLAYYLLFGLYLCFLSLYVWLNSYVRYSFIISLVLSLVLLLDQLLFLDFTRVAILTSFFGILNILYFKKGWVSLVGVLSILLSFALRESGVWLGGGLALATLILIKPVLWKIYLYYKNILILIVCFSVGYAMIHSNNDVHSFRSKNYYRANVADYNITLNTFNDSIPLTQKTLLEAYKNGIVADERMSVDWLNHWILKDRYTFDRILNRAQMAQQELITAVKRCPVFIVMLGLCLLYAIKDKPGFFMASLYGILLIGIEVVISLFLKLPERISSPVSCIGVCVLLAFVPWDEVLKTWKIALIILCLFFGLILSGSKAMYYSSLGYKNEKTLTNLLNSNRYNVLYTTYLSSVMIGLDPFNTDRKSSAKLLNVRGWVTLLPEYHKIIRSTVQAPTYSALYLHEQKKVGIYIPDAHLVEVLNQYIQMSNANSLYQIDKDIYKIVHRDAF